jgi:hypothetical protein
MIFTNKLRSNDVAHALVRAASPLLATLPRTPTRCRYEYRHGTHECMRHGEYNALLPLGRAGK